MALFPHYFYIFILSNANYNCPGGNILHPLQNEIRNRQDLSGIWDFQADPEETGEQMGRPFGLAEPRPMAVPGSWNEQFEDLQNYLGLGW